MPGRQNSRDRAATVFLVGAVALGVLAAAVALSGGFEVRVGGVRIRSHSWIRPAVASGVCAAAFLLAARRRVMTALASAWRQLDSLAAARALTTAAVAWTLAAAVLYGTFAAGGGDSYGYVSQAMLFADGRLTDSVPLDPSYQWYLAHRTLTPLGFTPAAQPGVISPTYPPGLPLLMAPAAMIWANGVYLVVPLFGALLVWLCYAAGRACGDPIAGGVAAALVSVSPTFVFQVLQPMSDVPAAACWLAALVLASRGTGSATAFSAGVVSLAILIRPNLALLAIVPFAMVVSKASGLGARLRAAAIFIATLVPAAVALAWIQAVRYGSPLASGYGDLDVLFSPQNILPNLQRYPRWLTETHTWFIWVGALAPFMTSRDAEARALRWAALAFSAGLFALYLPYAYFQAHEWTYSRFLLPAIPMMLLLASMVSVAAIRRLPPAARTAVGIAVLAALVLFGLHTAVRRHAFELRRAEQRYVRAGDHVKRRLPEHAIVLAAQHSGSVRLYGQRAIVRWDLIEPAALDGVLATLRDSGKMPFMVVDDFEDSEFHARFAAANQAAVQQARLIRLVENVRIYAFD